MREEIYERAIDKILTRVPDGVEWRIMEVCGTHTMSIARMGIKNLLKGKIKLVSGPGCPVCVTADSDLSIAIKISRTPGIIVTTFGDMMRVPSNGTSLAATVAEGSDVRVVYSPEDALKIAIENPEKEIVFIAVGFETTAPAIAAILILAKEKRIENFSILSMLKTIPNALEFILKSPEFNIDGLILPGHVSTIIGSRPYEFIPEKYDVPAVITGFGDPDILDGLLSLTEIISQKKPALKNSYNRAVPSYGNKTALSIIEKVFEQSSANWRGIGSLENSGLVLRDSFAEFDAQKKFANHIESYEIVSHEPANCRCGEVIMGKITPRECPLFAVICEPGNPIGPCMVSSEGACAAEYKYGLLDDNR